MKKTLTLAVAATTLLVAGSILGVSATASAHNFIVSTTPAEGETLTTLPERFDVTTNDKLLDATGDANAFVVDIMDNGGLYYGDGCVTVEGPSAFTDAALGAAGTYTIAYQLVSADGHTVEGEFAFEWAPADGEEVSEGWVTPPVCGEERIQIPNVAATPGPSAVPSAEATQSETPTQSPAVNVGEELLWVGGAAAAIIVAIVLAMLLLRRRK